MGSRHKSPGGGSSQSRVLNSTLDDAAGLAAVMLCVTISSTSGKSVSRTEHCGISPANAVPTIPHPDPSSRTLRCVVRGFRRRSASTDLASGPLCTIFSKYITDASAASLKSKTIQALFRTMNANQKKVNGALSPDMPSNTVARLLPYSQIQSFRGTKPPLHEFLGHLELWPSKGRTPARDN